MSGDAGAPQWLSCKRKFALFVCEFLKIKKIARLFVKTQLFGIREEKNIVREFVKNEIFVREFEKSDTFAICDLKNHIF